MSSMERIVIYLYWREATVHWKDFVYGSIWYLNKTHCNPKCNGAFQLVICRYNFWGNFIWCIKKHGRKSTNETKHNVTIPLPWTFLPESHQTDSDPQWWLFDNGDDSHRARAPELTYCAFNEKISVCMTVKHQKFSYFVWSTLKCPCTYHPVCLVQVLWFFTVTWSFLWTKKNTKETVNLIYSLDFVDRKSLYPPNSSLILYTSATVTSLRPHETGATVFIIYGIISMHTGRQLCCALTG